MENVKNSLLLILGNQLFDPHIVNSLNARTVVLIEDYALCTYERHHQQKIVLFLAAMRSYADELRENGFDVIYYQLQLTDRLSFEQKLLAAVEQCGLTSLANFEIEDKTVETQIRQFAIDHQLDHQELTSPMFQCTRRQFTKFVGGRSTLRMAEFYKKERARLGILVDMSGQPAGGRWSFDEDNRKKLPKTMEPPAVAGAEHTQHVKDVIELVSSNFSDHPGDATQFWWPTTRIQAKQWLSNFISQRLELFGPYEDALSQRSTTVFHSVLSPMINMGLLTPDEIIADVLAYSEKHEIPIQSLEGLVRQIIGWREFVRGVYQEFSEKQDSSNYWSHHRELSDDWYQGTTDIPPLDDTITTANQLGWTHHIPRLMVVANLMTLCEIKPSSVHRWFMEMYVDSSEWVMGPNVYGMGIFSDGGIFATKPYICGSNYLLKMSDYKKGDWCDTVDGLYWRFIDKHQKKFAANPRLSLMTRALGRLKEERKQRIFAAAEQFLSSKTN